MESQGHFKMLCLCISALIIISGGYIINLRKSPTKNSKGLRGSLLQESPKGVNKPLYLNPIKIIASLRKLK